MWPFRAPGCPIDPDEREWIDESLAWFGEEFGSAALSRPVILPTPEFFPGRYAGALPEVRAVVRRLCGYLDVDPDRIRVEVEPDDGAGPGGAMPAYLRHGTRSVGNYRVRDGKGLITIAGRMARVPMALVATVAHELCHELLLGGERIDPERPDGEPLTDLLSVYLGTGIFAANAAFEFTQHVAPGRQGWRASRLGYLTEPMYGYALARYALLRGEPEPAWSRYLDTNPRSYLKRSLRYLRSVRPG
jgi:hypothetical protein